MVVPYGVTGKLTPLAEVPTRVPAVGSVHHLMEFPSGEVALRLEGIPQITLDGVAVTFVGWDGTPTVTVTWVRELLVQPEIFH